MIIDWKNVEIEWSAEVPFAKENLGKFGKIGLYRLTNQKGEVVYIGSSYDLTLRKKLGQYFRQNCRSCLLRKKLKKEDCMSNEAIDEYFATLNVSICEYVDLEVYLVKTLDPKHNRPKAK